MAIKRGHPPESQSVDLTGLPESIVQSIKQLVESIREGLGDPSNLKRIAHLDLSSNPKEDSDETRGEAWEKFLLDPDKR